MTGVSIDIGGGKIHHLSEESAQMLIDRLKKVGDETSLDVAAKLEEKLVKADD